MPVNVIDVIKPKNNGTFPVVEAADVKVSNEQRLPAALNGKADKDTVLNIQNQISNLSAYITPEMFGAVGDGVTDDTAAIAQLALYSVGRTVFGKGQYYIDPSVSAPEFTNTNFITFSLKLKPFSNVSTVSVGARFINCSGSLSFESEMTELPATQWHSTGFRCSNVDISFTNGKYDTIRCKSVDECSCVRSTKFFADTIICDDTLFGFLTEDTDGVIVNNLYADLHTNDTELMHSLYCASGTKNVYIGNMISKNCPHYPIQVWSNSSDLTKRQSNVVIDNAILYGEINRAIANTGVNLTINRIIVESEVVDIFIYGDYKSTTINSGNIICNVLTGGYQANIFGEHRTFINNCDVKCRSLVWAPYIATSHVVIDNCDIHDYDLIGDYPIDALIKNSQIRNVGRMSGSEHEEGIMVTFQNCLFDGMAANDYLWANISRFELVSCRFINCDKTGYYFAALNTGTGKVDVIYTDYSSLPSGAYIVRPDDVGKDEYNISNVTTPTT